MSDDISKITNIPPSYPVKPILPSEEDRRSGRRRNHSPKHKPGSDSVENSDLGEEDKRSTIDEYI